MIVVPRMAQPREVQRKMAMIANTCLGMSLSKCFSDQSKWRVWRVSGGIEEK
jgi:hypothetical protein